MDDSHKIDNRVVWCDIPVADLDRAVTFYAAVLGITVQKEQFQNQSFAILQHSNGNGACLVPNAKEISGTTGILVYFGVEGRIRSAVKEVTKHGGTLVQDIHAIGPHGFCATVIDSEGNRLALHSMVDA